MAGVNTLVLKEEKDSLGSGKGRTTMKVGGASLELIGSTTKDEIDNEIKATADAIQLDASTIQLDADAILLDASTDIKL
jgi:hypothetical protein